jgi:APA family basic amino acid/polyamine antiporter
MPPKPLLTHKPTFAVLTTTVSVWRAIWAGLGAMVGAGIFVGLGIAAGRADHYLVLAFLLAALVALCSGLNSAQLRNYYSSSNINLLNADVYGYSQNLLNSWFGFTAAWSLALAQAATAAVVALGISGYLLNLFAIDLIWITPIALLFIFGITISLWRRLRLANRFIQISTAIGVLTLLFFIGTGLVSLASLTAGTVENALPSEIAPPTTPAQVIRASSLLVLAYAGFGQMTRLAQPPHRPRWNLPKTIGLTLTFAFLLYGGVAFTAVNTVGATALNDAVEAYVAPLSIAAQSFVVPGSRAIVVCGAIVTLLGVMSHLFVELSRVLWTLGQQRDLPKALAHVDVTGEFPPFAVGIAAGGIAFMTLANDVDAIWTFATFAFLLHCAIANLAAFQLAAIDRSPPAWFALLGVALCLFLILWLEWRIWLMGAVLVVVGLIWRGINLWAAEQSDG